MQYCKTRNFRLHFNFAKFANFVNSRKLSARESTQGYVYKYIHGKQRILSASEMSKTKISELLVQRIFHVIQYFPSNSICSAKNSELTNVRHNDNDARALQSLMDAKALFEKCLNRLGRLAILRKIKLAFTSPLLLCSWRNLRASDRAT